MSRRKQEKPQPRKNLVQGDEVAQDILTCGACQRDFPLCEIVRFIHHKVNACINSKDGLCYGRLFGEPPDDSNDSNEDLLFGLLRNNKKLLDSVDDDSKTLTFSTLKNALAKSKGAATPRPGNFICSTCKQSHMSAWSLLQHVQSQHGLKIYDDDNGNVIRKPNFSSKPNDALEQASPKEGLRVPLLEREVEPVPLFPRLSSQELRLDLLGINASASHHSNSAQSSPPPLIEVSSGKTNYEPQLDFYSQRLKELAGATSPNSSPVKVTQQSPKSAANNKQNSEVTSMNNGDKNVTSNSNSHLPQSSPSSTTSENSPASPKSNRKACEFCGKSFRFMSNLIVHRRSHTGEKPFKCHICNHACTQASKLNRHMKTHRHRPSMKNTLSNDHKSPWPAVMKNGVDEDDDDKEEEILPTKLNNHSAQNGEAENTSDGLAESPKSTMNNADEDEEIDVEDEDDDEDMDDEDEEEGERENGKLDSGHEDMVAEDLSSKKTLKNGNSINNCVTKDKKVRHSLLSEVMKEIGLASIQQYSKAYKQALKESTALKHERHSDGSASNDGQANHVDRPSREGTRSAGQSPLSFSTGLFSAFDQSIGIKRIKLEDHWREKDENNSLYAGMLIPSVSLHSMSSYKDLYSADGSDRRKSKNESALMISSPNNLSNLPSTSLSNLNSIANNLLKPKEQRRNDTCEYCGKVFKNCSNLTVHRRSHTGEKPYKCELCSYACAQSSKLTRHMKTHGRMGKDVYRCRFCDMPFSVPSTLEKHMRKCVVSQSGGSSYLLSERESDSKDMTSQFPLCIAQGEDKEH